MTGDGTLWVPVALTEFENPDWLPEYYCPSVGCSTCGAAFVAVDSLQLGSPHLESMERGSGYFPTFRSTQRLLGVELLCMQGHLTVYAPPDPLRLVLPCVGAVVLMYAAFMRGKRA